MSETTPSDSESGDADAEFTPVGTMSLLGIYFCILVVLWFFMYFIEFIGKGPTVIG